MVAPLPLVQGELGVSSCTEGMARGFLGGYRDGQVWGWATKKVCEHCNQVMGEVIDSCFGYYGDEFEDLGMTDEMPEEVRSLLPRAWGMRHDQHGWVWGEEETT